MESNIGLFASTVIAILIEIGLPVTLAVLIIKKMKVHWIVVLTGVLTFIGSQVVHIPLLSIPWLLNKLGANIPLPQTWPIGYYALYLGLLAGLCEETARWVGFKLLKKKAASYKSALALGIGHGGVESVIVGVVVLANLIFFMTFNPQAQLARGVMEGIVQTTIVQMAQFWASPWHLSLAGAFERIIAVSAQILMSVFVWKAVTKRSWLWFLLAVGYHVVLDAAAVYTSFLGWSAWQLEAAISIFLVFNVIYLVLFWKKEKRLEIEAEAAASAE